MTIHHLKPDPSKKVFWASGTSSEIFIYPTTGDFQARNFLFRISTATVEAEETVFTAFPNITRTLMVLKGSLTLNHAGHHSITMAPFEQDTFQGDWDTTSKGVVTDFNLMCKQGAAGTLTPHHGSDQVELVVELKSDFELFYLHSGKAEHQGNQIETGDCLVVENGNGSQVAIVCNEACDLIQASVNLSN
ncbi:MAG: HutD family protein [Reichenbachiella sp.]|uniref:HutD/Ves family protein n=1 Tax=Reichenbachiella sp. TaxID=2184521 RepID=UPI00326795C8